MLSWSPLTYYLYYGPLKRLGFLFEMLRHWVRYSDGCPLARKSEDTHQTNKCQSPYIKNRLYKCEKSQLGLVHINSKYVQTASKLSCASAKNLVLVWVTLTLDTSKLPASRCGFFQNGLRNSDVNIESLLP